MSRIRYVDLEGLGGQLEFGRQLARVRAALLGKPGQEALAELKAALLVMPNKRLIAGELCDHVGEVCALGVLARSRGVPDDELRMVTPLTDSTHEEDSDISFWIADWAKVRLGVSWTLAWVLQEANDEICRSPIPEELYRRVLDWVGEWVANPNEAFNKYRDARVP